MAVGTVRARGTMGWSVPAGVMVLAVGAGAATAVSPYYTLVGVAGLAVLYLTFKLPPRVLLFAFAAVTLSGLRPFPAVFGFHIQAQYFLIPPLFFRALAVAPPKDPRIARLWKPLTVSALCVVGASLFAFGQDILYPSTSLNTTIGDYVAWVIIFVFLWIFIRLAKPQGAEFGATLYRDLVDILGLFAAYSMVTSLLHFQSFAQANAARVSSTDLNPNETGVIVIATLMLILGATAVRGPRLRELIWLPFLLPLLLLTASRESLGALVVGLILLVFQVGSATRAVRYLYTLALIGVGLGIVLIFDGSLVPHILLRKFFFNEMTPYTHVFGIQLPNAIAERYYIQATAFSQFLHHPWLGSGFNRGVAVPEGVNSPDWWAPTVILRIAQDSYITVAAQQGLLGVIPFISLVVVGLRAGGKAVRVARATGQNFELAIGVRLAIFILALQSINIDALYQDFKVTMVFFWLVVIAILLQRGKPTLAAAEQKAPLLKVLPEPEPLHA